jgi:hypothetical protein
MAADDKTLASAMSGYKRVKKTSKPGQGKRFKALEKVASAKGAKDPGALAAHIGRKKYGKRRFQAMATAGRKRKG